MAIEIRNLSITSKVVQRRPDDANARDAAQDDERDDAAGALPVDWRIECRRMIRELLELQRER